ncbi:MAG: copper-binding protein [Pseudomonadota bacterium]
MIDIMASNNMLTIQHKPVPAWGWPDMLMDFPTHKNVDLSSLSNKQKIRFLVKKNNDGSIELIEIEGLANKSNSSPSTKDEVWIKGKIIEIYAKQQKLSVQHQAVKIWGWPAMLMDFPIIKSMDLTGLKTNMEFNFLVKKHSDGSIEVIEILPITNKGEGLK